MNEYYPNILLISGSGRNVGKTTFTCSLIETFSRSGIVAVKVSPHWHSQDGGKDILFETKDTLLIKETNVSGDKDSSRMLRSGASRVYYLQNIKDKGLLQAFDIIIKREGSQRPMIFESAALGRYMRPALHLHITRPLQDGDKAVASSGKIDRIIRFDGKEFDFTPAGLEWTGTTWSIIN